MSDQDNLTIDVAITTRAQMNTATPRFGSWTYHHVLPVRLYFLLAWTMIRVCKHPDSWQSTRVSGRKSLLAMCQNEDNKDRMRLFLDELDAAPPDADIALKAKLCASPPFGGFAGPNPSQRTDDPHESNERFPPVSASAGWWTCMKMLGESIRDTYALQALPAPNSTVSATKRVAQWCLAVETFGAAIGPAVEAGGPAFQGSDWTPHDNAPWTILRGPGSRGNDQDPKLPVKLRPRANQVTFIETVPAAPPNNLWRLKQIDDWLTIPAPPLGGP